jgi:hypothetical protein
VKRANQTSSTRCPRRGRSRRGHARCVRHASLLLFAAVAYQREMVESLVGRGDSTPLHLAVQATGRSESGSEAAKAEQARVIAMLLLGTA